MIAKKYRHIEDGKRFDVLMPRAKMTEKTIKRGATLSDTLMFIPKVVQQSKWQTEKLASVLKKDSIKETCKSTWEFVYKHIRYEKDENGREQIRSPARAWHDRFRGVDCDCYSVFISTILCNLKIPHLYRITKYKEIHFQHIYPVVITDNHTEIIIDCVTEKFNYEEPYTEKKDFPMELEYLDGLDTNDEIGKLFKKKTTAEPKKTGVIKNVIKKATSVVPKEIIKKGLNVVNKINPATVTLRNGVLASMKLNLFKVAQRLKWAYLTKADAEKRGIDMNKWDQLVKVKDKLENIFFSAGGKKENFKNAILTGKGNANKEVNGFDGVIDEEVFYQDHNGNLLGELGEPVTAATITAASGVIGSIAALLKNIGNIFPKKGKGSEDFENTEGEDNKAIEEGSKAAPISDDEITKLPTTVTSSNPKTGVTKSESDEEDSNEKNNERDKSLWEKNKKWLKPTLWGVGGLSLLTAGYYLITGRKQQSKPQAQTLLSGISKKVKSKTKSSSKVKRIELM